MDILKNPYRANGLSHPALENVPAPSVDASRPRALIQGCPVAAATPLTASPALAQQANVAEVWVKDERARMGMGSFKALGAAYVIARDAADGTAQGRTYITASAGNHGLSVAAGAAAFGANSVVYIAETVPESFAERLRSIGAQVVREGAIYEASMAAAAKAADDNDWALLSDSSWPGYTERPHILMEGYLVLMAEAIDAMDTAPSHIFLQAGVGGLAGAMAALARAAWGDTPQIIVVEPDAAPALMGAIRAGAPIESPGPVSAMGRLDCKEPSLIALKGLSHDADSFMTLTEDEGNAGHTAAIAADLASTPSGASGIAGMLAHPDMPTDARVLVILSEEAEP